MTTNCPKCGLSYDDTYRLTFCPHNEFAMRTVVTRADGETKVCTTVEEYDEFVSGSK